MISFDEATSALDNESENIVKESGTHEELMAKDVIYSQLYKWTK